MCTIESLSMCTHYGHKYEQTDKVHGSCTRVAFGMVVCYPIGAVFLL